MDATGENWTIYEAIMHEVPPELLGELDAARKGMNGLRRPMVVNFGIHGGPNPDYPKYKQLEHRSKVALGAVVRHLLQKLKTGDLIATGYFGSTSNPCTPILPFAWKHIRLVSWKDSTAKEWPTKIRIFEIRISRATSRSEVDDKPEVSKATKNVADRRDEADQCFDWLLKYIRKHPKRRVATRRKWWMVARLHWPKLSERRFNRLWTDANKEAEVDAWPAAGPPRKSDIREVPQEAYALQGPLLSDKAH